MGSRTPATLWFVIVEELSPAISRLCIEIEQLKKENAALKEGRPMDCSDEDIDIDGLSDSSETRDLLHTQLARHNVSIFYIVL